MRFELDHHVNLRPRGCRQRTTPLGDVDIDFVVVREGTEGPYTGTGGAIRVGTPHEVATEVSLNTAFGVSGWCATLHRAPKRRKHLTLVHKTNVLAFAGKLWSRIVDEVGTEFGDVEVAYQHIDAAPSTWSPIRAASTSSSPTTCSVTSSPISPRQSRRYWSGRQRQHRCDQDQSVDVRAGARECPRHRGQGIADPTAAIMSVALLLAHLGEDAAAAASTRRSRNTSPLSGRETVDVRVGDRMLGLL